MSLEYTHIRNFPAIPFYTPAIASVVSRAPVPFPSFLPFDVPVTSTFAFAAHPTVSVGAKEIIVGTVATSATRTLCTTLVDNRPVADAAHAVARNPRF